MRSDRTVLVTGANSGLGLATVIAAAKADFDVVGTVRSEARAEVLATSAEEAGVEVAVDFLDVTDAEACAEVVKRHRPWGLVNNAGFGTVGAIEDVEDEEARQVLETMVLAPARLARLCIPHMRAEGGGRILNVSSVYGFTSTPLSGWYQAAKHALEGLSDALRMEVAGDGISVVLIEPGAFDTPIWEDNAQAIAHRDGSRYASSYERSLRLMGWYRPLMGSAESAASTIVAALHARRPRARYLVGGDAWAIAAFDRLSISSVSDRVNRLIAGL